MVADTPFAKWLRAEMPRRGYKLEGNRAGGISRLAAQSGLGKTTVSRFVHGQMTPDLDSLRAIGGALGIPLGEMMVHAGLARPEEIGEVDLKAVPHLQIGAPGDPNPWSLFPDFGQSSEESDRSDEIDIWRDRDRPWQERAADIKAIRDGIGSLRSKWERAMWYVADAPRGMRIEAIRGLREGERVLREREGLNLNDDDTEATRKGA